MSRLIIIPQFPAKMRYQEWWFTEVPKNFQKLGWDVVVIGQNVEIERSESDMFSPLQVAIDYELVQVKEFSEMKLYPDDVIFLMDLSFSGMFSNIFIYKKTPNLYAFCHATAINKLDLFEPFKDVKFQIEKAHAKLFKRIFVGSNYHKQKLGWKNLEVVYLPLPPFKGKSLGNNKYEIVSVSRPTKQKVDLKLEKFIQESLDIEITRKTFSTWNEYYEFLGQSKILLITAIEDTFGYQIIDAVLNGCIPLTRNCCAYPEILDKKFIYTSKVDLIYKLEMYLKEPVIPTCKVIDQMEDWYEKISDIIRFDLKRKYGVMY